MHISLDLETWGNVPGSDLRSIGAVVFDPVAGNVSDFADGMPGAHSQFYIATDNPLLTIDDPITGRETYRKYRSLTRDPATIHWWGGQSPEAQAAFANPVDLYDALITFAVWLESINPVNPVPRYPDATCGENVRIWCKGSHYDEPILAAVYRAVGLPVPWHYRAPRDYRTIVEAAGITREEERAMFRGTAHNALDDAISQALVICAAYKRLGLSNGA